MKIQKAYKFRLYPTNEQKQSLAQQGGNCRFLWNHFLEVNQQQYKENKKFIFSYELITSLPKLKQEYDFLNNSFSQSLQQVGRYFDRALKDSFQKIKGFPAFKKKSMLKDSFTVPQKFRIDKSFVFIPKIGEVKWVKHQPIKGKVKHLTITQDGDLWFCSVNVELNIKKPIQKTDNIVGIDVGLKTFATLSDGTKVENPKILRKYEGKLEKENRHLSRKVKGSKNKWKQRIKVAKLHRKIRNVRKDFQHKVTHDMITKYDGFVLETLNIRGMVKNHNLAKSISDASWYEWKRQLKYKSEWSNKMFLEIGRWEASSKTCSCCGWYNADLTLADREFVCKKCGLKIDRDWNASLNIKSIGLDKVLLDKQEFTLGEIRGSLDSEMDSRCLSLNQEKEYLGFDEIVEVHQTN